MGGVSKPDLILGGVRLIDRVCGVLMEACGAGCVAVVPPSVCVPDGVLRTLEDPPSGGPLAGIDAGLRALSVGDDVLVVVVSVDAPGVAAFLPALLEPALGESSDGRIVRGGDPEPFDQYLMGVYRAGVLRRVIDEAVASQDWNLAYVWAYRLMVLGLDDHDVVSSTPGLTAREAADAATRVAPGLAPQLSTYAETFDKVRYGHSTITREEVDALRSFTPLLLDLCSHAKDLS